MVDSGDECRCAACRAVRRLPEEEKPTVWACSDAEAEMDALLEAARGMMLPFPDECFPENLYRRSGGSSGRR